MAFDALKDLDCSSGVLGRSMRDRQDRHKCLAVALALDSKHDDTRSIVAPFFLSALCFAIPKVSVRHDKAGLGRRY